MKKKKLSKVLLKVVLLPIFLGMTNVQAYGEETEALSTESTTTQQSDTLSTESSVEEQKNPLPADEQLIITGVTEKTILRGSEFNKLQGISAIDSLDGDLTSKISCTGEVNVQAIGNYPLTYTVTNSRGKTTKQTTTVKVIEGQKECYTIELPAFSLVKGSDYVQAIRDRIIIKDSKGVILPVKDVSLTIDGTQTTNKAGKIAVEVTVTSPSGGVTKKVVTIDIIEEKVSVISIEASDVQLIVGDKFNPYDHAKGLSTDSAGNKTVLAIAANATEKGLFVTKNEVDTSKPGTYKVTYRASDGSGKSVEKTIEVTVNRRPVILVEDKVMYVGDILTEEMILDWAKTENPEDQIIEFEVVDGEIEVYTLSNKLVKAGTHQIKFTASTKEGITEEKVITLTIKDKEETPTSDKTPVNNNVGALSKGNAVNTATKKAAPAASTRKELPKTGTKQANKWTVAAGILIVALAAGVSFKSKKGSKG